MKITVVGTGYVGLVTGACLAEIGHCVTCVDVDAAKIDGLKKGKIPIFEPGLDGLVNRHYRSGQLRFTTDLGQALTDSEVVYIGVGTPQHENGAADLQYIWAVAQGIRQHATDSKVVIVKSTVPPGTNAKLYRYLNLESEIKHFPASNPEFLREGLAVSDCLQPERIVVGVREVETADKIRQLYKPYTDQDVPLLIMSPESAEMTKYVANCLLATRISFMNEMANVCEVVGADVTEVREGIGHDSRIGFKFTRPGCGYGGSCFPKDTRAMSNVASAYGVTLRILDAVDDVNEIQKQVFFKKLASSLNWDLQGKTVTIWGLSFKPLTDDIREAPALLVISRLLESGVQLRVHDPEAIANVRAEYGERITYCDDKYDALRGADALAVMTEWKQFESPDFDRMKELMQTPIIVDGRNIYDPQVVRRHGFVYSSVGRRTVAPDGPHAASAGPEAGVSGGMTFADIDNGGVGSSLAVN